MLLLLLLLLLLELVAAADVGSLLVVPLILLQQARCLLFHRCTMDMSETSNVQFIPHWNVYKATTEF